MQYCLYLRKSRSDIEKEKDGKFETLKRHKSVLLKYAEEHKLTIAKTYEEIVSGESIIHRPEMLSLLKDVEAKKYKGVLVMDIDRLGRGNMQEQGLILETFKNANTQIITPRKTYNLHDEFDEEYSEFEAFMARKELKLINRRLQRGRLKSVEEGNYIGTRPPYGYCVKKDGKRRVLMPDSEQAPIVKLIFDFYANQDLGCKKIAGKLNEMGVKTYAGKIWDGHVVLNIIKNEVYIGTIAWGKRTYIKSKIAGKRRDSFSNPKNEWLIIENAHEAIVGKELFEKAQEKLKGRYHTPYNTKMINPFAGIIVCEVCGTPMVYRPYGSKEPHIVCYKACGNKSAKYIYVESKILLSLNELLNYYLNLEKELAYKNSTEKEPNFHNYNILYKNLRYELSNVENQKDKLHDLVEQGIYDINTFVERGNKLNDKIVQLNQSIRNVQNEIELAANRKHADTGVIPLLKNVIDSYDSLKSAEQKNHLLKTAIEKAVYYKSKSRRLDDFEITLYPKI